MADKPTTEQLLAHLDAIEPFRAEHKQSLALADAAYNEETMSYHAAYQSRYDVVHQRYLAIRETGNLSAIEAAQAERDKEIEAAWEEYVLASDAAHGRQQKAYQSAGATLEAAIKEIDKQFFGER